MYFLKVESGYIFPHVSWSVISLILTFHTSFNNMKIFLLFTAFLLLLITCAAEALWCGKDGNRYETLKYLLDAGTELKCFAWFNPDCEC